MLYFHFSFGFQAIRDRDAVIGARYPPASFSDITPIRIDVVSTIAYKEYGLDLEPLKLQLADVVAGLLNKPMSGWWQNEEFMDSELGKFLKFIMYVK